MMAIPGRFAVNAQGQATYSIAIIVPPGTAGMVPNISLDYPNGIAGTAGGKTGDGTITGSGGGVLDANHNFVANNNGTAGGGLPGINGDGILGLSWTLSGFPTITRCARTLAQDGTRGGINYNANDRFCLNGQRLVATSGTYGADGSVYGTEIESYLKIVAHGTAGSGPAWFEVHLRSGETLQFGNTADSRILAVGTTTARSWALNKASDPRGNYFTATYTNDTTNGQFYPTRVDYTGNAGAGLATYNSVQFTYTSRPDIVPYYQAGSLQQSTVLLTDIKTYEGANLVHDYKLAYRLGSSTTHSRLTSVTLCDPSNVCLPATTFGWQGGTGQLSMTTAPASTLGTPGDFNGDGIVDYFTIGMPPPGASGQIYLGQLAGGFVLASPQPSPTPWVAQQSLDLNADGLDDLFMAPPGMPTFYRNDLTQFVQTTPGGTIFFTGAADFNGDSRMDMMDLDVSTSAAHYFLNNGDGTVTKDASHPLGFLSGAAVGDFNGDGCTDVVQQTTPSILYSYYCNPGVGSSSIPNWASNFPYGSLFHVFVTGDFNGDGKTDLLISAPTGATLYLATGTGLSSGYAIAGSASWYGTHTGGFGASYPDYDIAVGDYNGDGKADVVLLSVYGGTQPTRLYLSTGTGFVPAVDTSNNPITLSGGGTQGDFNSDGVLDLKFASGLYAFPYTPELLTSISNGIGATTTITYDRLNKNGTFYKKCANGTYVCGDTYPVHSNDGPIYVVKQVDTSNGIGGNFTTTYAYQGFKIDLSRKQQLGFAQVAATNVQTGIVTATNYRQDFPFTGAVASQTVTSGATVVSATANTYCPSAGTCPSFNLGAGTDGVTRYTFLLGRSVTTQRELGAGSDYKRMTATYSYDGFGNTTQASTVREALNANGTTHDSHSTIANATFTNDTTNWLLGLVLTTTVESIAGSSDITRTMSFCYQLTYTPAGTSCPAYATATGLIRQGIVEPGGTLASKLETNIAYDAFGNRTSVSKIGSVPSGTSLTAQTRTTSYAYDTKGRFLVTATNALSQAESWGTSAAPGYDLRFGLPTLHTDLNGLAATTTYDTFGRGTQEVRPDNNKTTYLYYSCAGIPASIACPASTIAFVMVAQEKDAAGTVVNGKTVRSYFDSLSRPAGTATVSFASTNIYAPLEYDASGRVYRSSRPYFYSGGTAKWTSFTYDALGRPTQATMPDGSHTSYCYGGLTTAVTNDKNQTTTSVRNAQDLAATIVQGTGVTGGTCQPSTTLTTTNYTYSGLADLLRIDDPLGNVTTYAYDVRRRNIDATSPDAGHWSYTYDAFDELATQTDAKSQGHSVSTTLAYDTLGRVTGRTDASFGSASFTTTKTYGSAATYTASNRNIGQIVAATSSDASYSRSQAYDSLGRLSTATLSIGGANHTYALSYNSDGRTDTLTYPSGLVAKYVYTAANGYLSQIKDNTTAAVLWTVNSRDAELHALAQTAGNNVLNTQVFDANTGSLIQVQAGTTGMPTSLGTWSFGFDTIGNLTNRSDTMQGWTEQFCYDGLSRLTDSAMGASCISGTNHKQIGYNAIGNITSKTGIGTYTYPASGASSVRPHAVSSITGTVNGVVNPSYGYDTNGNMTAGASRTVTYTAFNMADTITQGAASYALSYDDDHQRIKQCIGASCATSATYYLNAAGTMAEKFVAGATTTWRDYLQVDGKIVGERFCTGAAPCTAGTTWTWFALDHLGSIVLVTNGAGGVVERDSDDAWGLRRNPNGTDAVCGSIVSVTTRNFTGHEMLDGACLVNMNARIYDPQIARFMTVDPLDWVSWQHGSKAMFVVYTADPQNFNVYSYVGNNPLTKADPTGKFGEATAAGCAITIEVGCAPGAAVGLVIDIAIVAGAGLAGILIIEAVKTDADKPSQENGHGQGAQAEPKPVKDIPGNKPPFTGEPGSTERGGTGSRTYGPDGYPQTDREPGHPDEAGPGRDEHSHDWTRPADGGPPIAPGQNPNPYRGPARTPKPGDPPSPRGPNVPPESPPDPPKPFG